MQKDVGEPNACEGRSESHGVVTAFKQYYAKYKCSSECSVGERMQLKIVKVNMIVKKKNA